MITENADDEVEEVCANCGMEFLSDEDMYCRICGTKRGEGEYDPSNNFNACVYGPPMIAKIRCENCGFSWTSSFWGTDFSKYCPRCGQESLEKDEQMDPEFLAF